MALERIHGLFEKIFPRRRLYLAEEALRLKKLLRIKDELGLKRPTSISVVIPTFLRSPEDLSGYRYEVIRNELIILSQLLSKGILDEIIIVDGSRDGRGNIDDRLVRQIISTAYRSVPLFHDQVDLLNKFPALKDRAELGLYDFVFKIIHQMDPQIKSVARKLSILPQDIPTGKGAGLWLAIGASLGDIIAFLDSDIRSLEGWQVAALVEPILRTFEDERRNEFVKAYYTRLSVNLDYPERGLYELGGRVTRLFMTPILKVLARRGVLKGLEKFRYPLSGEFAGKRNFMESLGLTTDFGVETAMLLEIWKKGLIDKVAEADLRLFQHFPRSERLVVDMVEQIINLLAIDLRDHIELTDETIEEYLKEAHQDIESTQALFDEADVRAEIDHTVRRTFYKDIERDKRRVETYAKLLRDTISGKESEIRTISKMPPWIEVINKLEGRNFQNFIRRRPVMYTFELLDKQGIVEKD